MEEEYKNREKEYAKKYGLNNHIDIKYVDILYKMSVAEGHKELETLKAELETVDKEYSELKKKYGKNNLYIISVEELHYRVWSGYYMSLAICRGREQDVLEFFKFTYRLENRIISLKDNESIPDYMPAYLRMWDILTICLLEFSDRKYDARAYINRAYKLTKKSKGRENVATLYSQLNLAKAQAACGLLMDAFKNLTDIKKILDSNERKDFRYNNFANKYEEYWLNFWYLYGAKELQESPQTISSRYDQNLSIKYTWSELKKYCLDLGVDL